MKRSTVKQLRELLAKEDDDTVVVLSNGDHGYRYIDADVSTVLVESFAYGIFTEDHGEVYTPEAEYGQRISAVIIA